MKPTLVLLPGMEGTGDLFMPLLAALDSAVPTVIAGKLIYWGHIYFDGSKIDSLADVIAVAKAIANRSFLRRILQQRIRCAVMPGSLAGSAAAKM